MASYTILAIDPGATNVKGILRRQEDRGLIGPDIVTKISIPSQVVVNRFGIACEQAPDDLLPLLGELPECERQQLKVIVITSHGASHIPVDAKGDAPFGTVSYDNDLFDRYHDEFLNAFGGAEALYLETGSAEYGKGINALQQIYFLQREFPEQFATVTDLLPLSSFMAMRLTGNRFTCHTHTRNHAYIEAVEPSGTGWGWSRPVRDMGIEALFPPFRKPFEPYGTIKPDLAQRYGIPPDCIVVAAGHDTSIASLLAPNYINTGTWICNTTANVPVVLNPAMASRSIVTNADPYGQPLRTLMARLGQTREAYRAQFVGELPEDLPFEGIERLNEQIVPLAFMEEVGVCRSLREAALPDIFQKDPSGFLHALSLTLAVPEALSSILTSDAQLPLATRLSDLHRQGYRAQEVVIGGNFVNDLPDGQTGTFTGFFVRAYPGPVRRFTFPEPTSFAAHLLGVCARENKLPNQLGSRIDTPTEAITFAGDRTQIVEIIEQWEASMNALLPNN